MDGDLRALVNPAVAKVALLDLGIAVGAVPVASVRRLVVALVLGGGCASAQAITGKGGTARSGGAFTAASGTYTGTVCRLTVVGSSRASQRSVIAVISPTRCVSPTRA